MTTDLPKAPTQLKTLVLSSIVAFHFMRRRLKIAPRIVSTASKFVLLAAPDVAKEL